MFINPNKHEFKEMLKKIAYGQPSYAFRNTLNIFTNADLALNGLPENCVTVIRKKRITTTIPIQLNEMKKHNFNIKN